MAKKGHLISKDEREDMARLFINTMGTMKGKSVAAPNLYVQKDGKRKLSIPGWSIMTYDDDNSRIINSVLTRLESTVYMSVNILESRAELEELELKVSNCNDNIIILRDFFVDLDIHNTEFAAKIEETCDVIIEYLVAHHADCITFINKTGHGLAVHHVHQFIQRGESAWFEHIQAYNILFDQYKGIISSLNLEELVEVDTKVKSLNRVCKVPGSINPDGTVCVIAYANIVTSQQSVNAIYKSYNIMPEQLCSVLKKKSKRSRKMQQYDTAEYQHDALDVTANFKEKSVCIAAYNRLVRLFPLRAWKDGEGRGMFLFLLYNCGKVAVGQDEAYRKVMELREQMAEPKEIEDVISSIECIDEHVDNECHKKGFYLYNLATIADCLNLSDDEKRLAGFTEIEEQKRQIADNRVINAERDKLIAKLYLEEHLSSRAIEKRIKEECPNVKASYKTIQRAIRRLELDCHSTVDTVEYETKRVYANYKDRRIENVGQHSPYTLLSTSSNIDINTKTQDNDSSTKCTYRIHLMKDTSPNRIRFMEAIGHGNNAICLGGPGTGKSYLMNQYVNSHLGVLVTAPSGAAADRVNGVTIHKGFHLKKNVYGPNDSVTADEVASLKEINVVCIDECGNLRKDIFHHVIAIIRKAEQTYHKRIQVLLFGDFEQLKPVCPKKDYEQLALLWGNWTDSTILSDSNILKELHLSGLYLTQVHRQDNPEYQYFLAQIKEGNVSSAIAYFNKRVNGESAKLKDYMHLCPYIRQVTEINNNIISTFLSDKSVKRKTYLAEECNMKNGTSISITLFMGERVMTNQNGREYKNGTIGTVVKLNEKSITIITDDNRRIRIDKTHIYDDNGACLMIQIPVVPAYAMTIHKAQGATFDKVVVHGGCFEAGQLYVGLSRTRDINNLILAEPIRPKEVMVDKSWLNYVSFSVD